MNMPSDHDGHPSLATRMRQALTELGERLLDARDATRRALWGEPEARVRTGIVAGVLVAGIGVAVVMLSLAHYGERGFDDAATQTGPSASTGPIGVAADAFTVAPDQLRELSADEARQANAAIPVSFAPNPAARAFFFPADAIDDFSRAVDCLTAAIYYEAANEPVAGQAAVAQVVLNRSRHPAYPSNVCGVVFQGSERTTGCQFSFTCDGALARIPDPVRWASVRAIAISALSGSVASAVGNATHYHADYVLPYWAPRLVKVGQIGAHIFYRWPGSWGQPQSFSRKYPMGEVLPAKLAGIAAAGLSYATLASPTVPPVEIEAQTLDLEPTIQVTVPSEPTTPVVQELETVEPAAPVVATPTSPAQRTVSIPVRSAERPDGGSGERGQRPRPRLPLPSGY